MKFGQTEMTLSPWRRLVAALALFALLFAGTVSSVSHSMAMAATSNVMATDHTGRSATSQFHQGAGAAKADAATAHEKGLPHDHAAMATGGGDASGNCDQGCILCKDCALCGPFTIGEQPPTVFLAYYAGYALLAPRSSAGRTPALPSEPPRV